MLFSVLASFSNYFLRILLARNMSPAEYGLFYAVLTFVLFFLFFRDLGFQEALVKHIAEYKTKEDYDAVKTALLSTFIMGGIGTALLILALYFSSGYLAVHYFKNVNAQPILIILLVYILFSFFFRIIKGFLQGWQKITLFASFEFLKAILTILAAWALLSYGLLGPALAYAGVAVLLTILYMPSLLRAFNVFRYRSRNLMEMNKRLMAFALPSFATSVGSRIIGYIDTLLLTYFRTLSEVGVYNVVLPSSLVLLFLGRSIGSIALPLSSDLWAQEEKQKLIAGLTLIQRYSFLLMIPVIVILLFFSEYMITLFFGTEYASGARAFQILLIGVLFFVAAMGNNAILSGIGRPKSVTKIIFAAAALNLLMNLLLIPSYGMEGAALATAASYILVLFLSTRTITTVLQATYPWKMWGTLILPTAVLVISCMIVRKILPEPLWGVIVASLAGGTAYLLTAYGSGAFSMKELHRYWRMMRKQ